MIHLLANARDDVSLELKLLQKGQREVLTQLASTKENL